MNILSKSMDGRQPRVTPAALIKHRGSLYKRRRFVLKREGLTGCREMGW